MSSFHSAKAKLAGKSPSYHLIDLPVSVEDPLWDRIEATYELSLPEVAALKNYKLQEMLLQQQQPSLPQQAGITDLLETAKGGPLTDSEIEYALVNYSKLIDDILSKTEHRERSRLAGRLWIRLSVRIKTQTRLATLGQYFFDGPVPGAFGNVGTEVQFAVRGSSLFCAKIMRESAGDLQREHKIATRIHGNQICPTVMPVLDLIYLPGEPRRVAMVTPYYPIPLAPLANGNLHEEGCVNVALCGLATIKAFHRESLCHGDIKPGNMVLTARNDNIIITIDFGSAVNYGESLVSVTPGFGLDCPQEGSLQYDLTCLASSLYMIRTGEKLPATSQQLIKTLQASNQPSLRIAMSCLQMSDIDSIWESTKGCVEAANGIDRSLIVLHDTVWPI